MDATFTTWVYRGRNEREHELEVTYRAAAGTPARMYGDYPHPAEPGEVEIIRVTYDGEDFDTTREEDDLIYEEAVRRAPEDCAEYLSEAAEYRAEMRREERIFA